MQCTAVLHTPESTISRHPTGPEASRGAVLMLGRGENKDTSDMQVYGTSKIYLIMATKALNEKLKGTGVEVFAAHPGRRRHLAQSSCRTSRA